MKYYGNTPLPRRRKEKKIGEKVKKKRKDKKRKEKRREEKKRGIEYK